MTTQNDDLIYAFIVISSLYYLFIYTTTKNKPSD